ncbi:hypothetical protein R1flu_004314 [Riccia fluitans]|uniref:Uncharacterized protein n=1 Tax=Riccia fluitans TaxID=41844 RepID=A0ABD1YQB5_9MARC
MVVRFTRIEEPSTSEGGESPFKMVRKAKKGPLLRSFSVSPKVDKVSASKGKTPEELPKTSPRQPLAWLPLPTRKGLAFKDI